MIRIRLYRDGARLPDTVDLRQARELLASQDAFVWLDVSNPSEDDIVAIGEALGLVTSSQTNASCEARSSRACRR